MADVSIAGISNGCFVLFLRNMRICLFFFSSPYNIKLYNIEYRPDKSYWRLIFFFKTHTHENAILDFKRSFTVRAPVRIVPVVQRRRIPFGRYEFRVCIHTHIYINKILYYYYVRESCGIRNTRYCAVCIIRAAAGYCITVLKAVPILKILHLY